MPDDGTLLGAEIKAFLENDASNMTSVNNGTFTDIIEEVFYFRGQPARWFYGAAVSYHLFFAHRCFGGVLNFLIGVNVCLLGNDDAYHPETTGCVMFPRMKNKFVLTNLSPKSRQV